MSDTDAGARPPLTLLPKPTGIAPAHTADMRAAPVAGTTIAVRREVLFEIIERVKVLTPCDRNPERFHESKDELVQELFELATR